MKLVHSADWHLGRSIHGVSLLDDQVHALEQLFTLLAEAQPDVLVVAGDIYDRAVPPVEAVELFDSILTRLVRDYRQPTIIIAGNHDSAERLTFGRRLFAGNAIHIVTLAEHALQPITFTDTYGPVEIFAFPFVEPSQVRSLLAIEDLHGIESAMAALAERAIEQAVERAADHTAAEASTDGVRRIAIAHPFVTGGSESESERPLSVGTSAAVAHTVFDAFCFTALGHLHQSQSVGRPEVHYAGSPVPYSFSEEHHVKSYSIIDIDGDGRVQITKRPIALRRRMRTIEGSLEQLINQGRHEQSEDYIRAAITDTDMQFNAIGRLRSVWPNILTAVRRPAGAVGKSGSVFDAIPPGNVVPTGGHDQTATPEQRIGGFLRYITGEPVSDDEVSVIRALLQDVLREEPQSGGTV